MILFNSAKSALIFYHSVSIQSTFTPVVKASALNAAGPGFEEKLGHQTPCLAILDYLN